MQRRIVIALPFTPFLALAAPQGKGRAKGQQKGSGASSGTVELRFRSQDVPVILDYYRPGGGLPPGLAKRGDLPPGLEKQLRRKGTLPPGLQKKLVPFPADLEARLPPLPVGYHRTRLGAWALLIQDATNVIFDVIDLSRR